MKQARFPDPLPGFLGSEARARLLVHFVVHPDSRMHGRALARHLGIGNRSLQVELERLAGMGLLFRSEEAGRVLYLRDTGAVQWRAMEVLVQEYGVFLVLRDAFAGVEGLEAAFVFGSLVRGDARPDSDVDIFLYGNDIVDEQLGGAMLDASLALGRSVDAKRYDRRRFLLDAVPGASFLPAVLAGPRLWIVGSDAVLPRPQMEAAA